MPQVKQLSKQFDTFFNNYELAVKSKSTNSKFIKPIFKIFIFLFLNFYEFYFSK